MRAAVFTDYGQPLDIRSVPEPSLDPDGAIIELSACGICRSDWHAWMGHWEWRGVRPNTGHIFGHEPVGEVIRVGSETETVGVGDIVTIPFNLGDGTCSMCRTGNANICANRRGLGFVANVPGAWAEFVHVPAADHNAVQLPTGISTEEMAGLGCRFMTAFHALAHKADVQAGDWLAVHGCGGIGLSAIQVGNALGANVIGIDLKTEKLRYAEKQGAVETIDASTVGDVPKTVIDITDGGAHISVDALGLPETCQNSIHCLRKLGQHVQIGLTTKAENGIIPLPTDTMVLREIKFIGSLGMQPNRYHEIFRMVAAGKLDPASVVTDRVALEDISDVLHSMSNFETIGIPIIVDF